MERPRIGYLGFGEAAQAFAQGLSNEGLTVDARAYDIKVEGAGAAQKLREYALLGVAEAPSPLALAEGRDLVFSLVTADQAEAAALSLAKGDLRGMLFLDCNSCAPQTKRRAAELIAAANGRYVDVALMTPVHPRLHKSPCLLAGPHAEEAADAMRVLGMTTELAGEAVGQASMRKMVRSVMIKGLEALTLECFLAARSAGMEDEIMASLDASFPGFDWQKRAAYMIERVVTHGQRRAAEMEEVARTLRDLGLSPTMTSGTIARQRQVGAMGLDSRAIGETELAALCDAVLGGLKETGKSEEV